MSATEFETMTTTDRLFQQAQALHRAGRLAEAEVGYRQVLKLDPRHADSLNFLGVAAAQRGDADAAVQLIGQAIRLRPSIADFHDNLGLALLAQGRLDEAGSSHRKALRLNPNHAGAHNHFGNILAKRGQPAEAERHYRTALKLQPNHVEALNNLGVLLTAEERLEEAEWHLRAALRLAPGYVDPYANLGGVLRNLGRLDEAEDAFRAGLRLTPTQPALRYNLAGLLLLTGRYDEGWPLYEARQHLPGAPPARFGLPQWRGEDLGHETLLLHAEQGAGDVIMACRYLTRLPPETRFVVEVPPALARLVASLVGAERVVMRGAALPAAAFHCPLASLPLAFGTRLDTIPAPDAYLRADPAAVTAWQDRLGKLSGMRVGLVWAGNPDHADDRRRSLPPVLLAPLAALPGVSFVSLQKGAETARPPVPLADWSAELGDFVDTAALIAGLDLVIGVDTAVIHLAGALGRPAWLLNRFDPHFLWQLGTASSAWYSSVRQFRQSSPGDWAGVAAQVAESLATEITRRTQS